MFRFAKAGWMAVVLLIPIACPTSMFAQTGGVSGVVTEATSGSPLPSVNVFIEGTTLGAATDPDGRFLISPVPAGKYRLAARLLGYATARREIEISSNETVEIAISLEERRMDFPEIVVERVMLTGGRRGLLDVPGSAHYIGPRELATFNYNDIQRILRSVPGINIQEEDGYGLRPNIGMRGTGSERSSKITVMEDGVLMSPAPYAAPAAYYFPTAGRMQGVEVRKGSSQIKYGPYTTGGALNLISTQIPTRFSGHAEILAGSNDERTLHAHVGQAFPNVGFLVETYQAQSDGFKRLESGGDTGFDKKDYLVKLRLNTKQTAKVYQALTLKISQTDEVSNETYLGLTEADFERTPNLRYAGSQLDQIRTDQWHFIARHLIQPTPYLDVTSTFYHTDFERDWFKLDRVRADSDGSRVGISSVLDDPETYAAEYAILRGQSSVNDNALEMKHNNREYYARGIQSTVGLRFNTGSTKQDIEAGFRYHIDEIDRFQWTNLFRMDNGVMELTEAGIPGTESNLIETATALALYVQYRLTIGRLTATPGFRYENIVIERMDYGKNDTQRTGLDLKQRQNDVDVLIPGMALDYAFSDRAGAFVGVHKGFAPPGSAAETKPEESVNYEVGARYGTNAMHAEGVFFFNDYSNLLGADLAAGGGDGTTDQFNGGDVHVAGLEVSLGYDVGALTPANLSIPVRAAYTFTRAEFLNAFESEFEPWGLVAEGDELPYLPEHQLTISLGLRTLNYQVEASGKYMSRMRTVAGQGDFVDRQSTDASIVVDLAAGYNVTRQIQLFTSVRNATDVVYIAARRPAGLRPGLPRALVFGVKTDF